MVKEIGKTHIIQIQYTESSQQGVRPFFESSGVSNKDLMEVKNATDATSFASASEAQHVSEPILDYTPATPNTPPEDIVPTITEAATEETKDKSPNISKTKGQHHSAKRSLHKVFSVELKNKKREEK